MSVKQKLVNYKNTLLSSEDLTVKEQISYSGGIFGNAMGQDMVHTYSNKFNRNYLGISNDKVTLMDNISTVSSFIIPPIAGTWYDSLAKSGKKSNITRALTLAPIPFTIASLLLFIVPTQTELYNFIWALLLTLVFNIADTFFDMAMAAIPLKLIKKQGDRKNFYTVVSIASTLGSMLPGWIIPVIIGATDNPLQKQWFHFLVALVFAAMGTATMYAPRRTLLRNKDGILGASNVVTYEKDEKVTWDSEALKLIIHNRPFIIVQLVIILDTLRQVTYSTLPYLYEDTFDKYSLKSIFDMVSGVLSYIGLFSTPIVAKRFSERNILAGGYGYAGFFYGIMSIFNFFDLPTLRKQKYIVGTLIGVSGMPNAAQGIARNVLVADSTDYMEWYARKNGLNTTRCEGVLIASQNIMSKINSLLKVNIQNGLMSAIKYQRGSLKGGEAVVQSNSTLKGIFGIVSLCGLAGNALAAIALMFYNYTGKRKDTINAELAELRAVAQRTKEQVEQI